MASQRLVIYNPLRPGTPLHNLWRRASSRKPELGVPSQQLLTRYRAHLEARPESTLKTADNLRQDDRPLVRAFGAFLPAFLEAAGAPQDRAKIPVVFPVLGLFDARLVQVGDQRGIFITSRMLDAIELFARTLSACARLNGLAVPVLAAVESSPGSPAPLAWIAFQNWGVPGFTLDDLLEEPAGANTKEEVEREIFMDLPTLSDQANVAMGRHRLAAYLAQVLLAAVQRILQGDFSETDRISAIPTDLPRADDAMSVDSQYLAALVLTFIVLHEQGHDLHGHNSIEPVQVPPELTRLVESTLEYVREHPDEASDAVDLTNSTQRLEQDADCFAIEASRAEHRDAMLEAATLWFAVLSSSNRGGVDWLTRSMQTKGRAYPSTQCAFGF
jgi:hypothetical protein